MKRISLVVPALLVLAACDNGTQGADATAEGAAAEGQMAANSSVAPTPTPPPDTGTPAPTEIPEVLRGRWGLVPADCTSTRGDAKGLLTITGDELRFYESVGTLDTIMEADPMRIRAAFEFQGEGMTWQREVVLDVQDDGATLIRREYGEDAAPGPFRYATCT
jgi:predicted small secreted protein